MEVRRQQANYRCTLYRLQFCGSFQDMCRCRAFQMLHTQQSSSHPLGPSTMLYPGAQRLNDQGTNMSSEKCRAAVNMFFAKSLLCVVGGLSNTWGRWALGLTPWDGLLWCHGCPGEGNPHISSLRQTWLFYSVPHLYEMFHVFPFEIKNWLVSLTRMNFP